MALILSQLHPQALRKATGYMDICDECGSRYRRMSHPIYGKTLCGACYPAPLPLVQEIKRPYIVTSSAKGD